MGFLLRGLKQAWQDKNLHFLPLIGAFLSDGAACSDGTACSGTAAL